MEKLCKRCGESKALTEEFFYRARPRKNHPKEGWQSNCRLCWKEVNAQNKARRRFDASNKVQYLGWTAPHISYVQQRSEGIVCFVPQDIVQLTPQPAQALEELEK